MLDGGAIVLPVFHSTARVNLKTLRLQVERGRADSLITKDRLRVDIGAEFYVRVRPDSESIALAAQTLGELTNNAEQLREQVEAKFVDGLPSVAATVEILELQEKLSDFVKHVQTAVEADVKSNGLELEPMPIENSRSPRRKMRLRSLERAGSSPRRLRRPRLRRRWRSRPKRR